MAKHQTGRVIQEIRRVERKVDGLTLTFRRRISQQYKAMLEESYGTLRKSRKDARYRRHLSTRTSKGSRQIFLDVRKLTSEAARQLVVLGSAPNWEKRLSKLESIKDARELCGLADSDIRRSSGRHVDTSATAHRKALGRLEGTVLNYVDVRFKYLVLLSTLGEINLFEKTDPGTPSKIRGSKLDSPNEVSLKLRQEYRRKNRQMLQRL